MSIKVKIENKTFNGKYQRIIFFLLDLNDFYR